MIDLAAGGIFAATFGSSSPIIQNTIIDFCERKYDFCSYAPHRSDYWREKYIAMLKEFTGFESVALFSTGAEATEAFWRCCRVYNNKPGIWGGLVNQNKVGKGLTKSDAMTGINLGHLLLH